LAGVWARGASKKIGTLCVYFQPLKLATSNLVHNLGLGLAYQKTFWIKIGGGLGQGSIRKKIGTPYVLLQLLKLTTTNSVHKLGLGLAYQKTTGVWARGASKKNLGPPTYFCNRWKYQLQIWYTALVWDYLTKKTTFRTKIGGGGGWARGASEKNWDPLFTSATVEASDWKIGTQLEFWFILPNTSFI